MLRAALALLAACLLATPAVRAQAVDPADDPDDQLDLTELPLDALLAVEIEYTTAARKPQTLMQTSSALYVLTSDQIRRSGADTIPEALRLVPGLHVARATASVWDIAARGFNTGGSNKMLVLVDGRSVYTILDGGVFWDQQDLPLEDIDRIEVIRGPGGSLWGANAFNGVINIITKSAADTVGTLVSGELGTADKFLTLRHGGRVSENGFWRVWARTYHRDGMDDNGGEPNDGYHLNRAGFRMDWDEPSGSKWTLQGDVYDGKVDVQEELISFTNATGSELVESSTRVGAANVLGRWTHEFSDTNDIMLQAWLDHTERNGRTFENELDRIDVEFSQHIEAGAHDIVWGAGYRYNVSESEGSPRGWQLDPERRTFNIFNLFVQDEITAIDDTLTFTVGSKFEHNSFTGWEVQPTGRFTWTPNAQHTVWGAVSRAVRVPSLLEEDGNLLVTRIPDDGTVGGDSIVALVEADDMEAERVTAYELGYRAELTEDLFIDVATYYNSYDDLASEELLAPIPDGDDLIIPFQADNGLHGNGKGIEVYAEYQVTEDWRLASTYTWQKLSIRKDSSSNDTFGEKLDNLQPRNLFNFQSYWDIDEHWELDAFLYYVDELRLYDVDSFWRGDVRLGYSPDENQEYMVGVRNLFHDGGAESELYEVETEFYVRGVFRF